MIYFDNAATTKPCREAIKAAEDAIENGWGNPSAKYNLGIDAKKRIERARCQIANLIYADSDEIFFTSGSTEANNIIHELSCDVLTTNIEHSSLSSKYKLIVNEKGRIYEKDYRFLKNYQLFALGYVNNEIGVMQPITTIGDICRENDTIFYVDGTQAVGHVPINVKKMNIDMMCASGHKFGGIKGSGFIYINKNVQKWMKPIFLYGGHQERGFRSGTENVAGIVAMGEAAEKCNMNMANSLCKLSSLKRYMMLELIGNFNKFIFNSNEFSVPYIINVSFLGWRGEEIQAFLNENDIYVSTGSACDSNSSEPSHVLKAIGLTDEQANSSIRISFSPDNTEKEIDEFIRVMKLYKTIRGE